MSVSEFLTGWMVKIFAGGVICAIAMRLSGDGARREIVRLCGACLMLLLIFAPLKGEAVDFSGILDAKGDVGGQIDAALRENQSREAEAVAAALEQYITELAAARGVTATAAITYRVDADGAMTLTGATVNHAPTDAGTLAALRADIARDCGVPEGQIMFLEGTS
jgi:hypothetical protein